MVRIVGDALVWSAWVQAAATAAVGVLTFFLVRFTARYVKEMHRTNELQAEANRLTAASLAVAQGEALPLIVVRMNGRSVSGGVVTVDIDVENNGAAAQDVVVLTSWGESPLNVPVLPAGGKSFAEAWISEQEWRDGGEGYPDLDRVRYRDTAGQLHEESVRKAPEPPPPMIAFG
jgi:hypothetical protein